MNSTGVKWPFQFKNGRVATSSGDQHVEESVRQIIGIGRGEVLLQPTIGCDLNARVFDPVNVAPLAEADIKSALSQESRVLFVSSSCGYSQADAGQLTITLDIRMKDTNQPTTVSIPLRS